MLAVLEQHGVRCVVIGGYAAVLAGADILTRDLDITPELDPANLERLANALAELHAAIRVPGEPPVPLPADARLLARAEILNLITDAGELDITASPDGTNGYPDLKHRARPAPGHTADCVTIAALEDIIRSKTAAGRAKDLQGLPALQTALDRERRHDH
jgi:hypothetical protein